ncbi:ATP-binding protein [Geitlerinema sp. P-1104]|uniref:ATP-binding protein n=1 Tax=Geitlerinema sp. P-1104 TaxID=2546230 RepID=UPI0014775A08|nr:anti-sigma regulatory factor [Geitlerinema sp. P-1104]NMG58335.1 ATP-binding protein [Geitlerinema sp. P-1104]
MPNPGQSRPLTFLRESDRAVGKRQSRLTVASDLSLMIQIQRWFEDFCLQQPRLAHWSDDRLYCLKLAIAEGFSNAVRHAHRHRSLETPIDVELSLESDRLEIRIWDFGYPFNPEQVPEPEPGTLCLGGYGWFLLRRLCDRVTYQRDRHGRNCLLLEQRIEEF